MEVNEKKSTDLERMSAGRLYNCTDRQVFFKHARALRLIDKFNRARFWNIPKQKRIIKKLIPDHGRNFFFMQSFRCEYGFNIKFGDDLFVNFDCIFMDVAPIKIGNGVMFGTRVTIATPVHPLLDDERIMQQYPDGYYDLEYAKPVTIEDRVWIASNVTICGGVTVGKGSVICAGSVITRDIPANCLAGGVPCKVIRYLDEQDRMNVLKTYENDEYPLSARDRAKLKTEKQPKSAQ